MTKLPRISERECIRALERVGFYVSQNGSHVKLERKEPYAQVIVPNARELPPGTLRAIIRQAGLTVAEFMALL